MQVKSHGMPMSGIDYNRCTNNINNNNSYNSQLANSFLNKSSPTRNNPPTLDIVGKVRLNIQCLLINFVNSIAIRNHLTLTLI